MDTWALEGGGGWRRGREGASPGGGEARAREGDDDRQEVRDEREDERAAPESLVVL